MVELTPDVVLRAYACGLFPMAERPDEVLDALIAVV